MNNELTFVAEEDEDGGYVARAIDKSIFTQGETLDELMDNIREAVMCHFENHRPKSIKVVLTERIAA